MPLDWSNPDYDAICLERIERLKRIRAPGFDLDALHEYYAENPADFIDHWGQTFDPRQAEIGLPTTMPFCLFPRQRELINWLYDGWKGRQDGLVEKSRDIGASWICVAFAVWMWRYHPGTVVGFGSRKAEYVDASGDPKSLFWKVRQTINLLPKEFRPAGYDEKTHSSQMKIVNPDNGAAIVGEGGDNIGRGNRTAIYFVDEAAFLEHPELVDAALSATTNCQVHVSSANGSGNPFYRKRHSGKWRVFTFHWRDDPRKDDAWYEKQRGRLDPVVIAQEIDIDYNASVTDSWISGEVVAAAQRNGPANVEAHGAWVIGVDAAHFGDDESIIHKRRGRLNLPQITRRGVDGPSLAGTVEEECDRLVKTGGEVGYIVIELDGPGVSAYDCLRRGRYADKVRGVHTGARRDDQKNYNLKAWAWRRAKEYLEQPPVSLPNDAELKSQLGAYKYQYRDGLLLMQSKKEYKKQFGKSPDRADAFVLTFAVDEMPKKKPALPKPVGHWMG